MLVPLGTAVLGQTPQERPPQLGGSSILFLGDCLGQGFVRKVQKAAVEILSLKEEACNHVLVLGVFCFNHVLHKAIEGHLNPHHPGRFFFTLGTYTTVVCHLLTPTRQAPALRVQNLIDAHAYNFRCNAGRPWSFVMET